MSRSLKLTVDESGNRCVKRWSSTQLDHVREVGTVAIIGLRCQYHLVITENELQVFTPKNHSLPIATYRLPSILDDDATKALQESQLGG